jgi:hypothetical protein
VDARMLPETILGHDGQNPPDFTFGSSATYSKLSSSRIWPQPEAGQDRSATRLVSKQQIVHRLLPWRITGRTRYYSGMALPSATAYSTQHGSMPRKATQRNSSGLAGAIRRTSNCLSRERHYTTSPRLANDRLSPNLVSFDRVNRVRFLLLFATTGKSNLPRRRYSD